MNPGDGNAAGGRAGAGGGSSFRPARVWLAAFALSGVLYVATMAPGVLWQDSGLAQVRTLRRDFDGGLGLALAHPLYYAFTTTFQWIPVGEPAWRTNFVSAVFGAITIANLHLFLRLLLCRVIGPGRSAAWAAAIGATSLTVAHTFWQHCALAEVYTVTTALLTAELLCLERFTATRRGRWLVLLFFANGLGISNHMFAGLSLAVYAVLVLAELCRRRLPAVVLVAMLAAWCLGASIYLGMIVDRLAAGDSAGEVLRSALFGGAGGGGYAAKALNPLPGLRQLRDSVICLAMNYPTPLALLMIPGAAAIVRKRHDPTAAVVAGLAVIHLVFAVRYDVPDQFTFFIPTIVLLAVVLAFGVERFLRAGGRTRMAWAVAGALLPVAVYLPLPQVAREFGIGPGGAQEVPYRDAYTYFLHPWKFGEAGPRRFADEVLKTLAPDAFLWADGTAVRPVQYLKITQKRRPDVTVFPPLNPRDEEDGRFGRARLQPWLDDSRFYVVTPRVPYAPRWLLEEYELEQEGVVWRVVGLKGRAEPSVEAASD